MKSVRHKVITIERNRAISGPLPPYIELGQRHLEKGQQAPLRTLGSTLVTFTIPVDMMRLIPHIPKELIDDITSVELTYRRRP